MAHKYVGQRVKRTEDPRLISGLATYVDDVRLPGMTYCAILRSPHAHARIRSMNLDKARQLKGVLDVVEGKEVKGKCGTVPCAAALEGLKVPDKYALAVNKVIFVGDPVAAVVAEDRYTARDALDLIEVDYRPLPAVVDPEKALDDSGPLIYPKFKTNVAFTWKVEGGSFRKALREADVVVKQRIVNQRLIPVAMEPRGVVAQYHPGGERLTVWSSTQIPHLARTQVALMLGIPENLVRFITPEVGGGFGSKLNVYGEEALIGYLAMKLGRPVCWIEGRRENMTSTIHGRGQYGDVEVAARKDGKVLGLRYKVVADLGAYHQLLTPAIPTLTGLMIAGAYDIPAASMEVTGVFTNKMSTDAYRGAGRPEATYVVERIMAILAAKLGKDPVEVRRKNFPTQFPYTSPTQVIYDSGDYDAALKRALKIANYRELRKRQKRLRKQGRLLGIGLSTYVEICAMGPSPAMPVGGWESATVRIEPTGKVTVLTGASPHGQGQETSFAQIAADMLGVGLNDVSVIHGDTAIVQYGIGTFGSRGTAVGGTAMVRAIESLVEKSKVIAAALMNVNAGDVAFKEGIFRANGKSASLQEVTLEAYTAKNIPAGTEPGLSATYFFEPSNFTFPNGTHICVVEVDRETGEVEIVRYVAVDDCGKVINPLLVEGQIHGGIAQALGQALMEEATYDESGQLVTGTLMDYAVPKAHDIPWFETDRTETPSPVNPLGVKGVGEAGTIGGTPAIANAVIDALAPLGIDHIDMPLNSQKIWRLIQEKEAS